MKQKMMKSCIFTCLIVVFSLASSSMVIAKQKPILMRIASDHPVTAPHAVLFKKMEQTIPELTDGRIKFEAYFGGSLYSSSDALIAVQTGSLEMCIGSRALAPISSGWSVISDLPFLFQDSRHYQRFLKSGALEKVDSALEQKNILHMSDWMTHGFGPVYFFNNKKNIETMEDLKGIKMRIPPNPVLIKMLKAFGMGNVAISPPEVVTALEQGMIDGTLAHAFALKSYNLKHTCNYMTKFAIVQGPLGLAFSKSFWNKLSPDLQKILWDYFKEEGEKLNNKLQTMGTNLFDDYAKGEGNMVTKISKTEQDRWIKAMEPIYRDLMKDDEIRTIIEAANAVR